MNATLVESAHKLNIKICFNERIKINVHLHKRQNKEIFCELQAKLYVSVHLRNQSKQQLVNHQVWLIGNKVSDDCVSYVII